jgi:hypothetical protein
MTGKKIKRNRIFSLGVKILLVWYRGKRPKTFLSQAINVQSMSIELTNKLENKDKYNIYAYHSCFIQSVENLIRLSILGCPAKHFFCFSSNRNKLKYPAVSVLFRFVL